MTDATCSNTTADATGMQKQLDMLPERVADMREKLLEAAELFDLNKLRAAIERNEVMPLFGAPGKRPKRFAEAIDFLKEHSFDGMGRETFALLDAILNAPYVRHIRKPVDMYIWPAQAIDENLAKSTPVSTLYRFVAFADLAKLNAKGLPPLHRVEIGADGTWHFFAVE